MIDFLSIIKYPTQMDLNSLSSYDHRYWLYERFLEGKRRNPRWSLRAFAASLNISAASLSEILANKRTLTSKMALRLAEKLDLSADQTQLFVRSALLAKRGLALPSDKAINNSRDQQFTPLDLETFKIMAEWYYLAILCLTETSCPADPSWIAKKLRISEYDAMQAIRRLQRLGFIKKKNAKYVATTKSLSLNTQGYEKAIQEFISQNLKKAEMSLYHDPAEDRELNVITMAIDPKNIPKARDAIKRFRRELCDILEHGEKKRVYSFAMQLFPLDKE